MRLSLRMSRGEALAIFAASRQAGLAPGAFVSGLVAGVPVLTHRANHANDLGELASSNAELSTLSRNIHHPASLLRQGEVRAAQVYRVMLDTLAGDVRVHLKLAARTLAELQPQRRHRADIAEHPTT